MGLIRIIWKVRTPNIGKEGREIERKGARYYNSKSRPKRTVRSKQ